MIEQGIFTWTDLATVTLLNKISSRCVNAFYHLISRAERLKLSAEEGIYVCERAVPHATAVVGRLLTFPARNGYFMFTSVSAENSCKPANFELKA